MAVAAVPERGRSQAPCVAKTVGEGAGEREGGNKMVFCFSFWGQGWQEKKIFFLWCSAVYSLSSPPHARTRQRLPPWQAQDNERARWGHTRRNREPRLQLFRNCPRPKFFFWALCFWGRTKCPGVGTLKCSAVGKQGRASSFPSITRVRHWCLLVAGGSAGWHRWWRTHGRRRPRQRRVGKQFFTAKFQGRLLSFCS